MPGTLPAGSPATQITITGQNFTAGSTVNWTDSGAHVTSIAPGLIAANQILATVPVTLLTSAGSVQVSVVSPGGSSSSNPVPFTVQAAATSVLPNAVSYGSALPLQVTITGAGQSFSLGSTVKWTSPAGVTTTIAPSALVQAAQVTATLPASLLKRVRGRISFLSSPLPVESEPVVGSIPRIARLMALAIRFDRLLREETIQDYAQLARLGRVTRARMTQIMKLLDLAPDIQEQILLLPSVKGLNERNLRPVVSRIDWGEQRRLFQRLCQS